VDQRIVDEFSLDELNERSLVVEALADETPDVDAWCSGPDWVIPCHLAFAPGSPTLLLHDERGMALLARYELPDGRQLIGGLEPLWGFASPLLGPDPASVAATLAARLDTDPDWSILAVAGVPATRAHVMAIARGMAQLGEIGLHPGITRRVIRLDGGPADWLARRSAKFGRNLRNAQRRAERERVSLDIVDDQPGLFERILAIERVSWKGAIDDGITAPPMRAFYGAMVPRLQRTGRARCVIARRNDADIGYILGGVRNGRYRGLQLSYASEAAGLSLGHLLQFHEIARMSDAGCSEYDLGMDMAYKERMADDSVETVMIVVSRT
jgi:CelD/BcsL family acetyltransferase involved in cellulose biosynthesis